MTDVVIRVPASSKGTADRPPRARRFLEYGLLALLVLSPLPAASVHAWSVFAIELAAAALVAAYVLLDHKPTLNPHLVARMRWPKIAILGLAGFVALQVLPLPRALVGLLSPAAEAFRVRFSPGFAAARWTTLSLAPGQTLRAALELAAYIALGWLVVKTINRGSLIRRLIFVLTSVGVFEALYGMYELTTKTPRILFYKKPFSPDAVTGTFVNGSHMAGYLEMIIPLTIGLLLSRVDFFALGGSGLRDKLALMGTRGWLENILLVLAVVVMSLGVLLSRSRSGAFVLVFSFLLMFELVTFHFGRGLRRAWLRNALLGLFALVTILALYIGIGATIQKFALDNMLRENRPVFWSNTLGIVADFPFAGTGLGTFASVYPAYEAAGGPELFLAHAHNDYLEFLSELGFVGFGLLLGTVLFILVAGFLVWRTRRNARVKALGLGGLVSLTAILLHSLTDFNLHIPANALLFAVTLGLTFVMVFHKKS
jgi:hypothetical protein